MRWLFVSVIGMSVGLGTLLITLLDNLLRGYSVFWWVMLTLLTLFSILVTGFTVMMRIN
jgi:hypothetical protein